MNMRIKKMIFLFIGFIIIFLTFKLLSNFSQKKSEIIGKVVSVKRTTGLYDYKIQYCYNVNEKLYVSQKSMSKMSNIGDRVRIEFLSKNPQKNDITGVYNDFGLYSTFPDIAEYKKFRKVNSKKEFILHNGIVFYYKNEKNNNLENAWIGEYRYKNDTIFINPYFGKSHEIHMVKSLPEKLYTFYDFDSFNLNRDSLEWGNVSVKTKD